MAPAIAPNPSRLPDMFFLSSKSSPSEPEEMVWMSSLSTAGAAVWPAAGFRLAPLSPSLSVLLDSVSTSCGGAGVRARKGSERRRPLAPLPFSGRRGLRLRRGGGADTGQRKTRQEAEAKAARTALAVTMVTGLMRGRQDVPSLGP